MVVCCVMHGGRSSSGISVTVCVVKKHVWVGAKARDEPYKPYETVRYRLRPSADGCLRGRPHISKSRFFVVSFGSV